MNDLLQRCKQRAFIVNCNFFAKYLSLVARRFQDMTISVGGHVVLTGNSCVRIFWGVEWHKSTKIKLVVMMIASTGQLLLLSNDDNMCL